MGKEEDKGREWKSPAHASSGMQLQALFTIAGGLVGATAYLYLLGGLVLWLKLKAAQLPTDDAMQVLDRNRLLAVGVKTAIFEAVLIGGLAIVLLGVRSARKTESKREREGRSKDGSDDRSEASDQPEDQWATWKNLLHGALAAILAGAVAGKVDFAFEPWFRPVVRLDSPLPIALTAGLFAAGIWLLLLPWLDVTLPRRSRGRWAVKTGLTVIACLLAVFVLAAPAGVLVLVLLLFLHLSHLLQKLVDVRNPITLMPVTLGMGAAVSLVIAVYIATPPVALDRAAVFLKNGRVARGGYVGQSAEGVFLAGCNADPVDPMVTTHVKLRIVAADRIRRIKLAGKNFVIDYGEDPSLADLGRSVLSQGPIETMTDTVSIDVRDPELACGRRRSVRLVPSDPGRHAQQVIVSGQGSLELTGNQFRTQVRHVREASLVSLPLRLNRESRRAHLCGGTVRGWIDVRFTLAEGKPEHRKALLVRRVERRRDHCPPLVHRAAALNAR